MLVVYFAGSTASSTVRPLAATTQHSTQLFLVESPEGTWCYHEFPCVIFDPIDMEDCGAAFEYCYGMCWSYFRHRIDFRSNTVSVLVADQGWAPARTNGLDQAMAWVPWVPDPPRVTSMVNHWVYPIYPTDPTGGSLPTSPEDLGKLGRPDCPEPRQLELRLVSSWGWSTSAESRELRQPQKQAPSMPGVLADGRWWRDDGSVTSDMRHHATHVRQLILALLSTWHIFAGQCPSANKTGKDVVLGFLAPPGARQAACRAGQSVRKRHQQALSFCVALWSLWMEMDQNCKNHSPKLPNIYCTIMLYMFTLTFEWLNSLCIKLPHFDRSSFFGTDAGATVEMAQQLRGRPYSKSLKPGKPSNIMRWKAREAARVAKCHQAGCLPRDDASVTKRSPVKVKVLKHPTQNNSVTFSPDGKGKSSFFLSWLFSSFEFIKKWNVLENWPAFLTHKSYNLSQVPDDLVFCIVICGVFLFPKLQRYQWTRTLPVSEFHQAVKHSLLLRSFAGWAMWCPAPHLSFFGTRMN